MMDDGFWMMDDGFWMMDFGLKVRKVRKVRRLMGDLCFFLSS